jgi:hypothetical protein
MAKKIKEGDCYQKSQNGGGLLLGEQEDCDQED